MDCFGEIVPVPNHSPSSHVMPNVNGLSKVAHSRTFVFRCYCGSENSEPRLALDRLIKFFHIPRITEPSTEVHRVGDFLKKFQKISEIECHSGCSFYFILRLSIDQFQFNITNLLVACDDHARLFTETTEISVPSVAAKLCSGQCCLKFVRSSRCCGFDLSDVRSRCSH